MNDISKKIEEKIKKRKIKMKPKSYFLAISVLYIVSTIVIILFAFFLASFVLFSLKASGANYLLGFGYPGILSYFRSIPWLLILTLIILILLVEIFSKKIDLVSKKPLIYSLAAIIIVIVGFGAIFANTNVHNQLLDRALDNRLPFAGSLYKSYGTMSQIDKTVGKVIELNDKMIILEVEGENIEVLISDQTRKPRYFEIEVNDQLYVFGENNNGQIEALGIREINDDKPRFKGSKAKKTLKSI